jgi:hypothetical protein
MRGYLNTSMTQTRERHHNNFLPIGGFDNKAAPAPETASDYLL